MASPRDGFAEGWLRQGMASPRDGFAEGWLRRGMASPRDGMGINLTSQEGQDIFLSAGQKFNRDNNIDNPLVNK